MVHNKICYFGNNQNKIEVNNGMVYVNGELGLFLGSGVDGEVYKYKDKAIKLFHDDNCVKSHLTKEQINRLSCLEMKHIILPRESLVSEFDNPGYIMEYVDLSKKKDILFLDKDNLIKEVMEIEDEFIIMGKNHFLLDDIKIHNLFYNGNFYMFDPDSFIYEHLVDFSSVNLDLFVWYFARDIIFELRGDIDKREQLLLVRWFKYLYKKGGYCLLSNFLEDIINGSNLMDTRVCYINKKVKKI